MFDHPYFDRYDFDHVPLERDLYLMEEVWLETYERAMVGVFSGSSYESIGYISYAAARRISDSSIELSWYPNIHDRFHEMRVYLPRNQFVCCVGSWKYDEKPRIFVRKNWLNNLYLRSHSVFGLIDAIGVREALRRDALSRDLLIDLRGRIDSVAADYPNISFISFADSLLLKSNWQVGQYRSEVKYTYEPEAFLHLFLKLQDAYCKSLKMDVYAVFTQGSNAYYDDALLHVSDQGNHISLNSLGLPFAQLMSIDRTARLAIHHGTHGPAELYMDATFFRSLRFEFKFDRDATGHSTYREPLLGEEGVYYYASCSRLIDNLTSSKEKP